MSKGKSLVYVEAVTWASVKPPFRFKKAVGDVEESWKKEHETLKEIFEHYKYEEKLLIAYPTDRLTIQLDTTMQDFVVPVPPRDEYLAPVEEEPEEPEEPAEPEEEAPIVAAPEVTEVNEEEDEEDFLCNPAIQDDDENVQRTREYMDRFHMFDAMPSSKDPTTKCMFSLIRRLVIQATLEFDYDDWDSVTTYLGRTKHITSMEGFLDHFHFNREWWYRHVRVYPPTARKGHENMLAVRRMVENSPVLKAAMTPKMALYFDTIETIIAEGKMEECYDVSLFQWDGTDKHGLDLWLRKRGSNRSEKEHAPEDDTCFWTSWSWS